MTQQTDAPKCAYPLPRCGKPYAADGGDFSGVLTACENSLPCPNHPTDDAPKEQEYVEFRKWYDEFAKDLSHRSACFHAWLSRDSLIASLREQLAEREGEIAKMTSDFASLICRDAHCEYDCEGWREALKQLSDYGIKEPKHAAEEFARLESDNAALRSHLERIAHEVGWKQDLDALEYEVHSVMNELDMWRDEGPRLRREIAELKGEKAT